MKSNLMVSRTCSYRRDAVLITEISISRNGEYVIDDLSCQEAKELVDLLQKAIDECDSNEKN